MTEKKNDKSIIVTTGGTGGHIFPADAFAKEMQSRGWKVTFLTDQRGMKYAENLSANVVAKVSSASPNFRKPFQLLIALSKLKLGTFTSLIRMIRNRPKFVVGFGGYSAFPVLLATMMLRIPIVVHEQNTVLGRVNRFVAKQARAVASGFERLDRLPKGANHIVTGNPIRQDFVANVNAPYPSMKGKIYILITGGSLGAKIFGDILPNAICRLPESIRKKISIIQQALPDQIPAILNLYKEHKIEANLQPFFDNMPELLVKSHLVIARSGASSVCEIACIRRPAIFVPLKIAMDDHQSVNANMLSDAGLAEIVSEDEISSDLILDLLKNNLSNPEFLGKKVEKSEIKIKLNATSNLADYVESLVKDSHYSQIHR